MRLAAVAAALVGAVAAVGAGVVAAGAADPVTPVVSATWPTPLVWGDDWTLTVTVTADGVVPTGTVRATWDGLDGGEGEPIELARGQLVDGSAALLVDGKALPVGGHGIRVWYDGDGAVAAAGNADELTPFLSYASSRRPVLHVTTVPGPHHRGAARVVVRRPGADMPVPTGNVVVRMHRDYRAKRVVRPLDHGVALLPLPRLHRGLWVLRARYLGDHHYGRRHGVDVEVRVR